MLKRIMVITMNKRLITAVTSIILVFAFILAPVTTFAEEYQGNLESSIRSFQKDYFMGVFHKTVQNGSSPIDVTGEEEKARKDLNYKIITGQENGNYSLYDRFGCNVTFPLYLGEKIVRTGAADKIYTAIIKATEKELTFDDAVELIQRSPTTYVNKYYQNRPPIKNNGNDPRVVRYDSLGGTTIIEDARMAFANWVLNIANGITSICCLLISDQLTKAGFDIIKNFITTNPWDGISTLIKALIPIFVVFVIIYVVRKAWPVFVGKYSVRQFAQNMIGVAISIGMLTFLLTDPATFIETTKNITTLGDKIAKVAINEANKNDEIVHSDSLDNVVQASIWEDAIFKPWVKGVFNGVGYEKLYTNNSGKPENDVWDAAGSIGNIKVPIGKDSVKNWGALAYSCQSKYHIDAIDSKYSPVGDEEQDKEFWPKAGMAASNKYIYNDDFRWLDASLKVGNYDSNSKSSDDKNIAPYKDIRPYNFNAEPYAFEALFMSLLLIPLIIIGCKKTMSVFNLILSFATVIGRSIMNMVNPENGQYNIASTIKVLGQNIVYYFWFCVLALIGISLYKLMAPGTFLMKLSYAVIMIYICRLNPQNYKSYAAAIGNNIRSFGSDYAHGLKRNIEDRISDGNSFKKGSSVRKRRNEKAQEDKEAAEKAKEKVEDNKSNNPDDGYQTIEQGDDKKYGSVNELNQSSCRIKKEDYEDAENKTRNSIYKERYRALNLAFNACRTNRDIAIVINKHRAMHGNKEMDFRVLQIPTDRCADISYYNDLTNADYNSYKATEYKKLANRTNKSRNRYINKKNELDNKIYQFNNSNLEGKEREKQYKKLKKEINKNNRRGKLDAIQGQLNRITGNRSGGSIVPLYIKLYIVGGAALAILFWAAISVIIGVI